MTASRTDQTDGGLGRRTPRPRRGTAVALSLAAAATLFGPTTLAGAKADAGAPGPLGVRQIVAHRGSGVDRPESTLAAVRRAIEAGATAVEVDVRTTADGHLVILHDETLDRTTDGRGPLAQATLADVRKLDAGGWFDERFRGERVPTLEDVLSLCRGRIDVLLDLKGQGEDYDRAVAAEVREHGDPRRTIVGVRSVEQAKWFRERLPEAGQLALIPRPDDIEAFADAGAETIRLWPKWLDEAGRGDGGADLVRRVRDAGARLHLNGTTGAREEVLKLLAHRPKSLSSDDPARLVRTLAELGSERVGASLLPRDWEPKREADRVLERLVSVTATRVKGAHDSDMVLVDGHAYIVAMVNDERPGEAASWPEIYDTMSIVDLETLAVEEIIPYARSEQAFENVTLPVGACFVPRIARIDDRTLRCFFASEQPGARQAQTWYRDFDLETRAFEGRIHKAKLKTAAGVFDMQPRPFYEDAAAHGFAKPAKDYGLYQIDSFKSFDGKTYAVINNFVGKQNALARVHDDWATFELLGHFNEPRELALSEASVNRLPDGTWMAICRQDGGNRNYTFTTSPDGRTWTEGAHRDFVPNGSNSKPSFDRIGGLYYLGWQEDTRIQGVSRSVFNVDVSRDGKTWERTYRFETPESFQYPTFREHEGTVWLCVTQGRKERIMFGKLEDLGPPAGEPSLPRTD